MEELTTTERKIDSSSGKDFPMKMFCKNGVACWNTAGQKLERTASECTYLILACAAGTFPDFQPTLSQFEVLSKGSKLHFYSEKENKDKK